MKGVVTSLNASLASVSVNHNFFDKLPFKINILKLINIYPLLVSLFTFFFDFKFQSKAQ